MPAPPSEPGGDPAPLPAEAKRRMEGFETMARGLIRAAVERN